MRDVKRKKKKKSHLESETTAQDGNIKLIHFHLTILSRALLDRLFCAPRLSLQNTSMLFKLNEK